MQFLNSCDELRTLYKSPGDGAVRKELRALDPHSKGFLAKSPFVLIGSSDGNGNADVTPKGDKPGFVAVLDDTTLAIPDRPGNNRLDTLENVVANPSVGLLFLIPGMNETLRVNGTARITADQALRERLQAEGQASDHGDGGGGQGRLYALRQGVHAFRAVGAAKLAGSDEAADARAYPQGSARTRQFGRGNRPLARRSLPKVDVVTPDEAVAAAFFGHCF